MSFDNDPPKHKSVRELHHPEELYINAHASHRSLIHKLLYPYYNAYTMEERKALILMHEKPVTGYLSRKEYKQYLAQKERIDKFLEQEKLHKESKEQSL